MLNGPAGHARSGSRPAPCSASRRRPGPSSRPSSRPRGSGRGRASGPACRGRRARPARRAAGARRTCGGGAPSRRCCSPTNTRTVATRIGSHSSGIDTIEHLHAPSRQGPRPIREDGVPESTAVWPHRPTPGAGPRPPGGRGRAPPAGRSSPCRPSSTASQKAATSSALTRATAQPPKPAPVIRAPKQDGCSPGDLGHEVELLARHLVEVAQAEVGVVHEPSRPGRGRPPAARPPSRPAAAFSGTTWLARLEVGGVEARPRRLERVRA